MKTTTQLALALAGILPCLSAQTQPPRPLLVNHGGTTIVDEPGTYLFPRDLDIFSDRVAIDITASGVTLDLGGHQLKGPGGKLGTGIRVSGAQSVKIYNGRITNFAFGVTVSSSANVVLTSLQITGQGLVTTAPPPEVGIMIIQSRNVTVSHNSLYNTGLGIFVRGGMSFGNRIENNNLTAGINGVIGICYNPTPTDPMGPRGDLIHANLITGYSTGIQMVPTSVSNVISENVVAHRGNGIEPGANNISKDNTVVQLP